MCFLLLNLFSHVWLFPVMPWRKNWCKSQVLHFARFTCDFQISHVICQIHLPYTGYFCPERLLRKSFSEKKTEICIREQFVTRMVRYDGEIENGDFDK